ncbi:MAG: LamG domain-containing protein, partial [Planctomycetaceae bacterium]
MIPSPTRSQQAELAELEARRDAAQAQARTRLATLPALQSAWEASLATPPADWNIDRDLVGHWPLADANEAGLPGGLAPPIPATLPPPTFPQGPPIPRAATVGGGAQFEGTRFVVAGDVANFGFYDRFTLSAWVFPEDERGGTVLSRMSDADQGDGYSLVLRDGRLQLNLVKRWLDDALRVETTEPLVPGRWHHVTAVYDGSRVASGVRLYVDGEARATRPLLDLLNQTFATKEPLRLGAGHGPDGRWRGGLRDVRVHQRALAPEEVQVLAVPDRLDEILALPPARRTAPQGAKLAMYFRDHAAPEELRDAVTQARDLTEEVARLID